MELKTVLIFPRLILALALAHTENGYLPLLVNLRARHREMSYLPKGQGFPPTTALQSPSTHQKPVHMAEVARGMRGATLQKGCSAHFRLH